jgi:4-amino-4-deoxy-L-arabinose transferase-like glycosyltransferase
MSFAITSAVGVGRERRRWEVWRSPDSQPGWARPALLGIAAIATLLYARNIASAGFEGFYSVAVKSMSVSWKAFFYGAFDPKATITLDKLAGSFVPQAISARIFGFHAWSLALPQVVEGVISVLVMYRIGRRWAGPATGLLAAAIFALTPVTVSMFGHSMEDGALTMCLVLAAGSCQRAMIEGRLRSLLWAGFWIGLGFQAKMLQAWVALPALAAGYLVTAPLPVRRRIRDVAIAGGATLAVSLSWIAIYTITPAGDRPYIDGSTNNSAISMVFGYNGLERFGVSFPGSVASMSGGGHHAGSLAGKAAPGTTGAVLEQMRRTGFGMRSGGGWGKLANSEFGPQIGWLFPLAVLTLACGLLWYWRTARFGGFVLWGVWLVSFGFVFSAMAVIPHTAYVASLAPALAALSGAGIVMFWREYIAGGRRGWLLPAVVAVELAWSAYLWRSYRGFLPAVQWAIVIAGAAAIVALVAGKLSRRGRTRLVVLGTLAGAAAMIAAPAAWAGSAIEARYDGNEMNATAGPAARPVGFGHAGRLFGLGEGHGGGRNVQREPGFRGGWGGTSTSLTGAEDGVYTYLSAHRDGAEYLMATNSWTQAAPYILATGAEVLPMGGFSGSVPAPTLSRVRHLVRAGQLRFVLLAPASPARGLFGRARQGQALAITNWVHNACDPVTGDVAMGTLYRCGS